jgi:hypothetical protein
MKIDPITHKVDPKTLTEIEAHAFIVFLTTEVERHQVDIDETTKLIKKIRTLFGFSL